jgi:glycosyltransferase involved in cell wall biosynthesis
MRIGYFGIANPEINATQIRLYYFARGASDAGHEVTIIAPDDPVNLKHPATRDTKVKFKPYRSRGPLAEAWTKVRLGEADSFDLVHVVGVGLRSLNLFGRPRSRPLLVQDYDELAISQDNGWARWIYYYVLEGLARQRAHAVTVASRGLETYVRSRRPGLGERLFYMPNGYAGNSETATPELEAQLERKLRGQPLLLWVGGFWRAYGVYEMLDLAGVLSKRGRKFVLAMIGKGPELEVIKGEALKRGLSGNVLLPGRIPDDELHTYMRRSQAFILPFSSTRQNIHRCPGKLYMYVTYNRPVVTNRVGEVGEALGDAGFYYRERDPESMADACEQAVAGAAVYDQSNLIATVSWSERAARYGCWLNRVFAGHRTSVGAAL